MKLVMTIICSFALSVLFAQSECKKCDGDIVLATFEKQSEFTRQDVDEFLCTIDKSCIDNVEFGQFSNEVLFLVANRNPKIFLSSLAENSSSNRQYIIRMFSDPINDSINVKKTIHSIRSVRGFRAFRETKKSVLTALRKALPKKR